MGGGFATLCAGSPPCRVREIPALRPLGCSPAPAGPPMDPRETPPCFRPSLPHLTSLAHLIGAIALGEHHHGAARTPVSDSRPGSRAGLLRTGSENEIGARQLQTVALEME